MIGRCITNKLGKLLCVDRGDFLVVPTKLKVQHHTTRKVKLEWPATTVAVDKLPKFSLPELQKRPPDRLDSYNCRKGGFLKSGGGDASHFPSLRRQGTPLDFTGLPIRAHLWASPLYSQKLPFKFNDAYVALQNFSLILRA